MEPEFQLPNCYTVVNTQPVHSKIGSFSDETLFYIFYTMPRDIMQEVVVAELYVARDAIPFPRLVRGLVADGVPGRRRTGRREIGDTTCYTGCG